MPNDPTTTLADELCDLANGDGATPTAIRGMPGLMGLTYIRAETPRLDDDVQEEAMAVTVRECIEQASYALEEPASQREDKDADRGAAARCLLGLYPGTGSMLRWERRKHAAGHLVKHVRTMTKPREVKGRLVSHETVLMEQLATQLWEREVDFLNRPNGVNSDNDRATGDSGWLEVVYNAWDTARRLSASLKLCSGFHRYEPDIEYDSQRDYTSLEWFAKFWQYIEIPAEDSSWFAKDDEPETGRASLSLVTQLVANIFGRGLPEILFVSSPFDRGVIERLSTEIVVTSDTDPSPIVREQITLWRTWLESCPCPASTPDPKSCKVHWFYSSLAQYIDELHKCWDELRDPYHTPAHFGNDPSPAKVFAKYGLRIPAIDKNS